MMAPLSACGRLRPARRPILPAAVLVSALASALGLTAFGGTLPARAEAVTLAPHRAVYDISLARPSSGAGVTSMNGRMVYEITGSTCAGYTQTMRFVTRSSSNDGNMTMMDLRSTSSESPAADKFTFSSSQYRGAQRVEATSGEAKRGGDGVEIQLSAPRRQELKFAKGVMFPIQHSMALIEKARAGVTSFEVDVYDGASKGDTAYGTVALIGARKDAAGKLLPPVKGAERLDASPAWPMTISYFDAKSQRHDSTPTYELSFWFFPNGVSRKLLIDYGDFAIRGTLKSIEFLEPTPCAPGGSGPKGTAPK